MRPTAERSVGNRFSREVHRQRVLEGTLIKVSQDGWDRNHIAAHEMYNVNIYVACRLASERNYGMSAQKLLNSRLNPGPIVNQLASVRRIQCQKSGEKARHGHYSVKARSKEQCNDVGYHIIA